MALGAPSRGHLGEGKKVKSSSSYRAKLKTETTRVSFKPFFDTIDPKPT